MNNLKEKITIEKGYRFYINRVDIFTDLQRLDKNTAYNLLLLLADELGIKKEAITDKEIAYNTLRNRGTLDENIRLDFKDADCISYFTKYSGGGSQRYIVVLDNEIVKHKRHAQVTLNEQGEKKIVKYFELNEDDSISYDTIGELIDKVNAELTYWYNLCGDTSLYHALKDIDKVNDLNLLRSWDMDINFINNGVQ